MSELAGKLRRLDMYQKIGHDVSKGTNIGGIISIFTSVLIFFFIFYELNLYLYPPLTAEILEDDFFTRDEMKYIFITSLI